MVLLKTLNQIDEAKFDWQKQYIIREKIKYGKIH